MARKVADEFHIDPTEDAPSRRRRGPEREGGARAWIISFTSVFAAALLANLLTLLIVRAYVSHQVRQMQQELRKP